MVEREMGGGPAGHPAADQTAVQHRDGLPGSGQFVGDRQPCDPAADHHHVGGFIGCEPAGMPEAHRFQPIGSAALLDGIHDAALSVRDLKGNVSADGLVPGRVRKAVRLVARIAAQ